MLRSFRAVSFDLDHDSSGPRSVISASGHEGSKPLCHFSSADLAGVPKWHPPLTHQIWLQMALRINENPAHHRGLHLHPLRLYILHPCWKKSTSAILFHWPEPGAPTARSTTPGQMTAPGTGLMGGLYSGAVCIIWMRS